MSNLAGDHFSNRSPSHHIVEKFSRGAAFASEKHGFEISGTLAAFFDSLKSTMAALVLFCAVHRLHGARVDLVAAICFAMGYAIWQGARSSWLGWSRLHKLHKDMAAEREEITANRDQERTELQALYHLKGFDPPLLDQVVEVLMADDDRLLKVMLEEELGLSLAVCDHPLKQGAGALTGALLAAALFSLFLSCSTLQATLLITSLSIGITSALSARLEGNEPLAAFFWNFNSIYCLAHLIQIAAQWRGVS